MVNGTASSPASRNSLQPHRRDACRASRNARRLARTDVSLVDSSMIPWLAETSRSAAISSRVMTPGFTCGISVVSFSTSAHISRR